MDDLAVAVYVRVSTTRQDLRAQEPELKAWVEANAGERRVTWYSAGVPLLLCWSARVF